MENKNRVYLYIALLIPLIMFGITAISLLFPQETFLPKQDFIYVLGSGNEAYTCVQKIRSQLFPGEYTAATAPKPTDCKDTFLYRYDVTNRSSTLITADEIKNIKLPSKAIMTTDDGYSIIPYCDTSNLSGWTPSNPSYGICIQKDDKQKRLNITNYVNHSKTFYYFYFISWLESPPNPQSP